MQSFYLCLFTFNGQKLFSEICKQTRNSNAQLFTLLHSVEEFVFVAHILDGDQSRTASRSCIMWDALDTVPTPLLCEYSYKLRHKKPQKA